MIVISDNSPLQYLVLIECIDVLPALYGEVLTTPQVIEELRQENTPAAVRDWVDSLPAWLKIESPTQVQFLEALDIGEASALSLARERQADLILIDERAGTDAARNAGLRVIGTLGILIEAALERQIDFNTAINRLSQTTSFYASRPLIEAAKRILHERQRQSDL